MYYIKLGTSFVFFSFHGNGAINPKVLHGLKSKKLQNYVADWTINDCIISIGLNDAIMLVINWMSKGVGTNDANSWVFD